MTRIEVPNSSRRRPPRRGLRLLLILLLLVIAGFGLWTWLTLTWAYSDGERAGVLQKFSRKGWICKTQEGELAQFVVAGVSPQIWQFSVRDPAVAAQLNKAVASACSCITPNIAGCRLSASPRPATSSTASPSRLRRRPARGRR